MTVNLPQLRSLALQKLRKEGSVPFKGFEGYYVGYVLIEAADGDSHEDRKESPLMQAAEFDIDVLHLGKWEWLVHWLSPYHELGRAVPEAIGEIALVLLGQKPIPEEAARRLKARTRYH